MRSAVVGAAETSEDLESVGIRVLQGLDGNDPVDEFVTNATNVQEVDLSSISRSNFVGVSRWDASGGSEDARGTRGSVRGSDDTDQQPVGLVSEVGDSSSGGGEVEGGSVGGDGGVGVDRRVSKDLDGGAAGRAVGEGGESVGWAGSGLESNVDEVGGVGSSVDEDEPVSLLRSSESQRGGVGGGAGSVGGRSIEDTGVVGDDGVSVTSSVDLDRCSSSISAFEVAVLLGSGNAEVNGEDDLGVESVVVNVEREDSWGSGGDGGGGSSNSKWGRVGGAVGSISALSRRADVVVSSDGDRSGLVLRWIFVTNSPTSGDSVGNAVSQVESGVVGVGGVFQSSSQETLLGAASSVLVVLVLFGQDSGGNCWDVTFSIASGSQRSKSDQALLEANFNGVRGGNHDADGTSRQGGGSECLIIVSTKSLSGFKVGDDESVRSCLNSNEGEESQKEDGDEASHFA